MHLEIDLNILFKAGKDGMSQKLPTAVVVDDNALLRNLYSHQLKAVGFDVVGDGGDGEEALTLVGVHHPDVMLLDLNMPVMGGVGVLRALKEKGVSDICVLMLSAEGQSDVIDDCILLGAHHYIRKDKDPDQLGAVAMSNWQDYQQK